ncbi:MAG: glucosyl transferase [Ignavibacteriales bacterium]|nr:glucosyl transferase [Ignavibacteriales bacterium]
MKTKYLSILFFLLVFNGCSKDESPPIVPPPPPPPDYRKITLAVEDISYTEAWINIKTDSINFPATITLLKNTNEEKFVLINSDTTVYVDSLQPNVNYTFQAVLTGDSIKSDTVKAKTLEPTSHNFTWQTWEFGTHSSSALYDVAIIDENNIWAVGEIYMNDSLGNPDSKRYNSAIWNGNEWDVKRIPYNYQGTEFIHPIQSVFAFSANDIWFCGNGVIHWDGSNYLPITIPTDVWGPYLMNKIWGTSSEDLYVVGNAGNLAHYLNGVWTKIESGTDLDLTDIYGDSEGNLYAAGINIAEIKGVVVKGDQSGNWDVMIEGDIIDESELFDKLFGSFGALWIDENNTIYTGGDFFYEFRNSEWNYVLSLPENHIGGDQYYIGYIYSIRGNKSNDIVVSGDRNTLRHFNGVDWAELGIPYTPYRSIFWRSVRIKDNLAVVVGDEGIKAKIMLLKR